MQSAKPLTGCEAVRAEAKKYSGWDANIITAIAQGESGCRYNATGDGHLTYKQNGRTYGYSVSVLQVRILPGREHCDSHDIKVNVKCAHEIFKNAGSSYSPWTVYNKGIFRQFL